MKQVIFNCRHPHALNDRQTVDYLPGQPYTVDDETARAVVAAGAAKLVAASRASRPVKPKLNPAAPKKKHVCDLQD